MAALSAVLLVVFSFGVVGPAAAATGTGNGKGNDQSSAAADKGSDAKAGKGKQAGSGDKSTAPDHRTKGTAGTSGDTTKPQPLSKADKNTGGANGQCTGGVYCSTRDGSPSGNGNGDGKATGKPCAGCVGKADNKNPKGQMPGPQDGNNGYECDGNNGIAKTNPAHTGCQAGEETPPPTTPGDEPCVPGEGEVVNDEGECVPTVPTAPTCPDGSMPGDDGTCANGETPTCPDGSMPNEDGTCDTPVPGTNRPPTVAGVEQFAGPGPQAGTQPPAGVQQWAGPTAAVGPTGILPSTGAGVLMNALAATGLGLFVLGAALLARRRSVQS